MIFGGYLSNCIHTVTLNNTVNGNSIHYYYNQDGLILNKINVGQIILVSCKNSIISNISLTHTDIGIELAYCNNITVENSTISNNFQGVFLYCSNETKTSYNYCWNNTQGFIITWLMSNRNIFSHNYIYNNTYGISLEMGSHQNIITNNTILSNINGVVIDSYDSTLNNNNISKNQVGIINS
jgi:parallel beta-helix repeat protein